MSHKMKKKRSEPDQQEGTSKTSPVKIAHTESKPTSPASKESANAPSSFTFAMAVRSRMASPSATDKTSPVIPSNKRRNSQQDAVEPPSQRKITEQMAAIQISPRDSKPLDFRYWTADQPMSTEKAIQVTPKFTEVTNRMKSAVGQAKANKGRGLETLKRDLEKNVEELTTIHNEELIAMRQEIEGRKLHASFLEKLVNDPTFSDIQILLGDKKLHAHKAVLASFIPRFDALYNKEEKTLALEKVYDSQPIDEETVGLLLKFVYTGGVTVPSNKVASLLALANFLQVDRLRDICCNILVNNVDESNCLDLLEWSSLHYQTCSSWKDVRQATLTFIASNCEKVLTHTKANPTALSHLNILSVKDIIISRELALQTKFDFFMRWALPKYNVYSIFDLIALADKCQNRTDKDEANCWTAVHMICMNYLANQFEQFCSNSQFASLSLQELKELVADDNLVVSHEDIVVKSVLRWQRDNMGASVEDVVSLIRWPYVSTSTIWACAGNPFSADNTRLQERLTEAILYQTSPADKKTTITTCAKRMSYQAQTDVQPQDFARELLTLVQSIGKKEPIPKMDVFVFVPEQENKTITLPNVTKAPPSNTEEFAFGTFHELKLDESPVKQ